MVWTDVALYSLQFIGTPLTFGLNLLNEGVSLIGPNAIVNSPSGIFWMDKKGFYKYNGSVDPVQCTVHSYVFDDFNEGFDAKTKEFYRTFIDLLDQLKKRMEGNDAFRLNN